MTVPTVDDVLRVEPDKMSEFIRQLADYKTLSMLVRNLNRDLLDGDRAARAMAARALAHLGLADHP